MHYYIVGAHHLRNEGRKMNFFQYHSYDVIFCYLSVASLTLFAVYKVLGFLRVFLVFYLFKRNEQILKPKSKWFANTFKIKISNVQRIRKKCAINEIWFTLDDVYTIQFIWLNCSKIVFYILVNSFGKLFLIPRIT